MKTSIKALKIFFLVLLFYPIDTKANMPERIPSADEIRLDFEYKLLLAQEEYYHTYRNLQKEVDALNFYLQSLKHKRKKNIHRALNQKFELENQMLIQKELYEISLIEIRYRKGIDLIKLLYEKILGLEHHFTGMQVYQNVSMLSNPNTYPEFQKAKEVLARKKHKKFSLNMPSLFQSNPFMSATFTLVSTFLSDGSREQKQRDFDEVACVLDFTVRMNSDLNTIRHEVEFLKKANENLKLECERLFEEYTKVVGYMVPLEKCRQGDDWETLYDKLNSYMAAMKEGAANNSTQGAPLPSKGEINLEFATRRVADFIIKYSDFTNRGIQYYQKFDNIISNYENESTCQNVIPRQFSELQFDIKSTIEKFNNTYNLPEIQGSRLKDLMFGLAQH